MSFNVNITVVMPTPFASTLSHNSCERKWIQMKFMYTYTWMSFNVNITPVIPTPFASTFSHNCKHFGIPKMYTFPQCTLSMVHELA